MAVYCIEEPAALCFGLASAYRKANSSVWYGPGCMQTKETQSKLAGVGPLEPIPSSLVRRTWIGRCLWEGGGGGYKLTLVDRLRRCCAIRVGACLQGGPAGLQGVFFLALQPQTSRCVAQHRTVCASTPNIGSHRGSDKTHLSS